MLEKVRNFIPPFLFRWYRGFRKRAFHHALEKAAKTQNLRSTEQLIADLEAAGVKRGDHLMVHASLSKIGFLEHGAQTLVDALKKCVGYEGIILMPTSPIASLQFDYVRQNPTFDVMNTPSAMGAVSEYFRKSERVTRSLHPTEAVAAWGENSNDYIKDHAQKETPYHWDSPYGKLIQKKGKILYIGVKLSNAGTHLHTLEDAFDVGVPVYSDEVFNLKVITEDKAELWVKTKVHNPVYSLKRRCDELFPLFLAHNACFQTKIGSAATWVFDAETMFETMKAAFVNKGVTMYKPQGDL